MARGRANDGLKSAITKRSIVLDGHKTSVSLEDGFWEALQEISKTRSGTLLDLISNISANRGGNLSSAVRLFVLAYYRDRQPRID